MTFIPLKFLALLPLVWSIWLAGYITEYPRGGLAEAVGTAEVVPAAAFLGDDPLIQWKREKIQAIWALLHRDGNTLPEKELDAFMAGDFSALEGSSVRPTAFILSGTPELELSPAGMLFAGKDGRYWPVCSAVLTRPGTVLSAGHCISGLPENMSLKVYFPFEGFRDIPAGGATLPCGPERESCEADLVIIDLAEPYTFVPPADYDTDASIEPGAPVKTLGFGMTSEILSDNGLSRSGQANIRRCGCDGNSPVSDNQLCFTTAYGKGCTIINSYASLSIDSGAPLFSGWGSGYTLLGLARGIEKACDHPGEMESQYTDIRNRPSIKGLQDAVCTPDCEPVASSSYDVLLEVDLALPGDSPVRSYPVQLGDSVHELVVTLNHEIHGFHPEPGADLELVLPQGSDAACQRHYGAETCTVSNPGRGVYTVGIKTVSGRPAYQLAAVAIYQGD